MGWRVQWQCSGFNKIIYVERSKTKTINSSKSSSREFGEMLVFQDNKYFMKSVLKVCKHRNEVIGG